MQLNQTKLFSAWGTEQEADQNLSSSSKVSLPQLVVGGKKVTLDDMLKVSFYKAMVVLDQNALEQVGEKAATSATAVTAVLPQPMKSETVLPREVCRAAIFQLIIVWMQGRSGVRSSTIEFFADMLNADCIPLFTSAANAPLELLQSATGSYTKCLTRDNSVKVSSIALRECGLVPLAVDDNEIRAMLQDEFVLTGMASFIGGYTNKSFQMLDVVAAMSCEAASVLLGESADPALYEILRPQRGQMTSAANLRLMLDGSTNENAKPSDRDAVFKAIPQVHGPACEASMSSCRYI